MEKKKELYVNEQVYDEVISRQEQNEDEGFGSRINEAYSYFNVAEIKKNLKIQRKIKKEGEQLVRDRQITLEKVSGGFLAALLAGFVAGYLVLLLQKIASKLPDSMDGIKPVLIYPLFGVFFIGVFMYAVNPAMAAINTGIINLLNSMGGSSKILLGAIVAGMMSIDMGGPFNKAAYVFGTASIASGNYDVMAAVMIGGMIPPLAIALATTFFKKKFTADERKSGVVNYIMGLCFITEGAIPFAASDPLRVIPSCVIGSAVAGGLSMMFGCTLRAPHGGIFVFPVVGNVVGYLIALAAGAVVGMLMLGILKKNKTETK